MKKDDRGQKNIPTVFTRLPDGGIAELIYSPLRKRTSFSVYRQGLVVEQDAVELEDGTRIVPVSEQNNLIKHRAILLPGDAVGYESVGELAAKISGYLYKYVDLSHSFRKIATCYILLTWVYDAFPELPYLRLRGDFGSGKTRALLIIGSVCYRPFFASGASTVSPIFHTLDFFRSTLILDEGDFRFSDEKSELVKIFNNGNVKGFPVLRTAITLKREFDPRAFNVFGPKLIAMRRSFDDQALESRFLTEEMGQRRLRSDIPINLPPEQEAEALALRNQLLMYRFETLDTITLRKERANPQHSPRLNQILAPLLAIMDDTAIHEEIWQAAGSVEDTLYRERSATMEANVLDILLPLIQEPERSHVTVAEVADAFRVQYGTDYDRIVSNRTIGGVLRKRLRFSVHKSHGISVIPVSEAPKVIEMAIRFGVVTRADSGTSG